MIYHFVMHNLKCVVFYNNNMEMAFQPVDLFDLRLPVPQLPIGGDQQQQQQQQENRELLAAISTPNSVDAGAMADCSPVDSPSPVLRNQPNFSPPAAPSSTSGNGGAHGRKNRPSKCVVCGRPTNCCHFDVPSCLGCRSFFRRSVLQQRRYTCPRAGNCPTGDAGQICRSCRFDRCLLGGMNLRAIKTFAQRPDLQALSLELEKRRQKLLVDKNFGEQQPKPQQPFLAIPDSTSEIARLLQSLVLADDKLLHIRYSEQRLLGDMFDGHSLLDILEGHGNFLAKADHFSKRRIQQMSLQFHRNLVLNGPPGEGHPSPKRPNWLFVDSFLCLHLAKTLPVLRELSTDGKLRLFSHNALAATVFSQCFYSFSLSSSELMLFPDGFTPLCFQSSPSMDENKQTLFCDNMAPFKRIGLTREEFLLLRSMLFVHTASIDELCPNDLRILQAEQQSYSQALMQYERQRLGNPAGVQRYAELIFFIQFLLKVGNQHRAQLVNLMVVVRLHGLVQHPDFIDNLILGISNTRTL